MLTKIRWVITYLAITVGFIGIGAMITGLNTEPISASMELFFGGLTAVGVSLYVGMMVVPKRPS